MGLGYEQTLGFIALSPEQTLGFIALSPDQTLAFIGFALVMAATPGPSNTLLTATAAQVGVVRALLALFGVAVGMAAMIFTVALGFGALILSTPGLLFVLRVAGSAVLLWLAYQIATAPATPMSSPPAPPTPVSSPVTPASCPSAPATPVTSPVTPVSSPSPDAAPSVGFTRARRVGFAGALHRCAGARRMGFAGALHRCAGARRMGPGAAAPRVGFTGARPVGFAGAAAFQWLNPKSWLASASAAAFFNSASAASPAVQAATLAALFVAVALPSCFLWLAFGAALHRLLRSARAQRTFNLIMSALLVASAAVLLLT